MGLDLPMPLSCCGPFSFAISRRRWKRLMALSIASFSATVAVAERSKLFLERLFSWQQAARQTLYVASSYRPLSSRDPGPQLLSVRVDRLFLLSILWRSVVHDLDTGTPVTL